MSTITTPDGVEIFFKDWGSGQPIVFSHGWPLSGDDWDTQMMFFVLNGYRVVAHDRRGHGRSAQTGDGHEAGAKKGAVIKRSAVPVAASRPKSTCAPSAAANRSAGC